MNVLLTKCGSLINGFLDGLDTLLTGLLFLRFELKLKSLAKKRDKKIAKVLKAQKEYEDIQKEHDSLSDSYKNLCKYGI